MILIGHRTAPPATYPYQIRNDGSSLAGLTGDTAHYSSVGGKLRASSGQNFINWGTESTTVDNKTGVTFTSNGDGSTVLIVACRGNSINQQGADYGGYLWFFGMNGATMGVQRAVSGVETTITSNFSFPSLSNGDTKEYAISAVGLGTSTLISLWVDGSVFSSWTDDSGSAVDTGKVGSWTAVSGVDIDDLKFGDI